MTVLSTQEAIDRINAVFGRHPHTRALHAKGSFYNGTFTATPDAARRCIAGHLQGEEVPILVRWSNGGGNPSVPDKAPDVRGMAVSFTLPDGSSTDLLGQTAPRFPVRTPEDFVAFTEAARKPALLPIYLLKHRSAVGPLVASAKAKALAFPGSYAAPTFYPIHAYAWIAQDGTRRWVRYVLKPVAFQPSGEKFGGPDALRDEMTARLGKGPVTFDLRVTVAADDDDPHDPMSVWKGAEEFSAGTLSVYGVAVNPEADGGLKVFDPTRIVEGIELSDDPILRYRALAYSESAKRRA
ncbi:MAG TPA: catalase [Marmoricola sp.]|nr:catalase [Marmoricola sp.]